MPSLAVKLNSLATCLHSGGIRASVLRFVLLSAGIGLSVPILQWCFGEQTFGHFWLQWGLSIFYAAAIGLLLWASMPFVWIRSLAWPVWLRWTARAALIVSACTVGCLIGGVFTSVLLHQTNVQFWADFWGSFRLSILISVLATAVHGGFETMQAKLHTTQVQLKTHELERERALKLATEAQLASLESRIHPHFLFNTINSVSSLIHEDPARAERLLTQMAALLRFSLDSSQNRLVPLELELRIVRDYLDIESARFGFRLRHEIAVSDGLLGLMVPPLALQTLVENSVKYAVNARRHGAEVRVTASVEGDVAHLQVSDDGPGFGNLSLPAGHGLSNLQERLHALFGEKGALTVASEPGRTAVELRIPLALSERRVAG